MNLKKFLSVASFVLVLSFQCIALTLAPKQHLGIISDSGTYVLTVPKQTISKDSNKHTWTLRSLGEDGNYTTFSEFEFEYPHWETLISYQYKYIVKMSPLSETLIFINFKGEVVKEIPTHEVLIKVRHLARERLLRTGHITELRLWRMS